MESTECINTGNITRYVRLTGFIRESYVTKGYVKCDGRKVSIETSYEALTRAIEEEIRGGLSECVFGNETDVLEKIAGFANFHMGVSDVFVGEPAKGGGRMRYRAEVILA